MVVCVVPATVNDVKPVTPDAVIAPEAETSPVADTVNTSIPDESFTSNKLPLFESVTVNSSPFEPDIVNIIFVSLSCVIVVPLSNEFIDAFVTSCVLLNTATLPLVPLPVIVIAEPVNVFNEVFKTSSSKYCLSILLVVVSVPVWVVPVIVIEPVVIESVVTMCSMVAEPSFFSKNILPSYVFIAISPKASCEVVGTLPWVDERFNFIVCAI